MDGEIVGKVLGEVAKKVGAETIRGMGRKKAARERANTHEVLRLKILISKANSDLAAGKREKALERLLAEVVSWKDGDCGEEASALRVEIADALEDLANEEENAEPGEED